MPKFALKLSLLHPHALPGGVARRSGHRGSHAGRSLPQDRYARGCGGHVLQRHAAGADRSRHHQHLRAVLHPGRQCRPQRIALADGRQPYQDLLQARHRSQRGAQQHRQPGHGRSAPPAARNAAAGGAGHGRFDAAGLPGNAERPGAERNQPQGSGAVPGAQPDLECAGRLGSAALWRNLSPDSDLCRSAEAGGAQPEPQRRCDSRSTART